MKKILTQSELKEVLDYNPKTGKFTWLQSKYCPWLVGCRAGSTTQKGYINIIISRRSYKAHRLVFLWMDGMFPPEQVDHINGKRDDNTRSNLRLVSGKGNSQNQAVAKNNTSGHIGVTFSKKTGKWVARIQENNKSYYLGSFTHYPEACEAYEDTALEFDFHPNHGRKATPK